MHRLALVILVTCHEIIIFLIYSVGLPWSCNFRPLICYVLMPNTDLLFGIWLIYTFFFHSRPGFVVFFLLLKDLMICIAYWFWHFFVWEVSSLLRIAGATVPCLSFSPFDPLKFLPVVIALLQWLHSHDCWFMCP